MAGLLKWIGRGVDELMKMGYPESVAKRIDSGELPMDEASRMARAAEQSYVPSYHSTRSNWSQVDPDAVDIGLHSGTTEQADMRLRDTATDYKFAGRGRDAKDFPYGEGAQVMPLFIKADNPLKMNDVGQWENAQAVAESLLFHPKFASNKGELEDIYSQMDEVLQEAEGYDAYERYIDIPDNRSFLDDLSAMIQSKGYDSVKYENTVENAYGSSSNYKPEVQAVANNLNAQIKQLENSLANNVDRPKLPTQADLRGMAPDEVTKALDAYLNWESPRSSELESLKARLFEIRDNPNSYMDTQSYISLKPENIRSKYAAFDPEYTGSNILGSRIAPTAATGILGAILLEAERKKKEGMR